MDIDQGMIVAEAQELRSSHIYLDVVSVGATINIMMAAALAEGRTILENAAEGAAYRGCCQFPEQYGRGYQRCGDGCDPYPGSEKNCMVQSIRLYRIKLKQGRLCAQQWQQKAILR